LLHLLLHRHLLLLHERVLLPREQLQHERLALREVLSQHLILLQHSQVLDVR
jgi:hypothetical protein